MNKEQRGAIEAITDSVIIACKKFMSEASFDRTYSATVLKSLDGKNDFYEVMVEGQAREIKNATPMRFDPSCPVWCTAPGGDISKMFISGRR